MLREGEPSQRAWHFVARAAPLEMWVRLQCVVGTRSLGMDLERVRDDLVAKRHRANPAQSAIPTIAAVIGIGDRSRETSRAHDQRQNARETDCCVSWGCRFLGDSKVRTGWPNVRDW